MITLCLESRKPCFIIILCILLNIICYNIIKCDKYVNRYKLRLDRYLLYFYMTISTVILFFIRVNSHIHNICLVFISLYFISIKLVFLFFYIKIISTYILYCPSCYN